MIGWYYDVSVVGAKLLQLSQNFRPIRRDNLIFKINTLILFLMCKLKNVRPKKWNI